jgi:hypothetical protein
VDGGYKSRVLHGKKITVLVEGDINPIELTYYGDFVVTLALPQPKEDQPKLLESQLIMTGFGHLEAFQKITT